jgi:hypothetical protein
MVLQRLRKILESGDFDRLAEVYAPDCFIEANVFAVTRDMVTEHVIYCPGPWDRQSRLRWAAEESLIRP